jgi:hypothetical protein
MRRALVLVVALAALIGALLAAPAAAGMPEIVGERIFLLCGVEGFDPCIEEFPADEPFWIYHGVFMPTGPDINMKRDVPAVGHFDFKLYVDGVEVAKDWTFHPGPAVFGLFVFPEGMAAGEVTLTAEWYFTCTLDEIGVVEGCEKPADSYVALSNDVTISFI